MSVTLGIDTSNYTTSVALYDDETDVMKSCGKLLPVENGERGLQQSKALFLHTRQLPEVLEDAFSLFNKRPDCVCVSEKPRSVDGSYMPVFSAGVSAATSAAYSLGVPLYKTSHQNGHVMAALYSIGKIKLANEPFIAFHISGGTTEALYVTPSKDDLIKCEIVAKTLDLNAGQVIDRVGVKLGMDFPCGNELDKLAQKGKLTQKPHPTLKENDCCLSGLENICEKLAKTEPPENVARFLFEYISETVSKMSNLLREKYGNLPFVYAGGVMRNSIVRENINGYFAEPKYSSDNAAGVAVIGSILNKRNGI